MAEENKLKSEIGRLRTWLFIFGRALATLLVLFSIVQVVSFLKGEVSSPQIYLTFFPTAFFIGGVVIFIPSDIKRLEKIIRKMYEE